jgi:hypothetical protein
MTPLDLGNSRGRSYGGLLDGIPWFSVTGAANSHNVAVGCFSSISILFHGAAYETFGWYRVTAQATL